jgi:putative ABC transport system permease protein
MTRRLPLALRLALRELRGGLSGFRVFIACIALGVAAIAGVNSVSRALTDGISHQGRVILGGDLAFSIVHREAMEEEQRMFREAGDLGQIATMRAMLRRADETRQSLVELKAVDDAYPHGGTLKFEDGGTDAKARLSRQNGAFGALVAPELLDKLEISRGDRVKLGTAELEVRGVIRSEPDLLSGGIGFGPRLIVSIDALRDTGLVRPGSLITWIYRVRLDDGPEGRRQMASLRTEARRLFPDAGWSIRSRDNASPGLSRNIERFSQFLTLVGLTALVVGGVGVANAVSSFVDLKRPDIATLKCLGAASRLIFRVYLAQIMILAALGIVIGLAVGATLPFIAKVGLSDLVPMTSVGLYPAELAIAVAYGLLVTLSFALAPLGRAGRMEAASLFADRAIASPVDAPWLYRVAQLLALACLAGLALLMTRSQDLAVTYIVSVVIAFFVLRLVAWAIMALARRAGSVRGTTLRLAIRNVHRPGALTPSVVLSLGLGLTLLVSLALIDTNLRSQLSGAIAERAPDFFFIDIQNREREDFVKLVTEIAPDGELQTVPMLRGRFVAIKGVPAAAVRPRRGAWALRGDRGITYAQTPPANSEVVAGEWWPPDYDGEPLVSMETEIAEGLGVTIGDEITVNVLGRNITARVANLRRVEWESLSINFVMVFSPNTFRGAPHAHLSTLRLPEGSPRSKEREVLSSVTRAFPGVTTISVREAIDTVNDVISDLALAVRVAASVALVVSMLVLGGALAAGHRQRRQDAVILKTLGATRQRLLTAFSLEYGLLGLATAVFAIVAGSVSAWYVVTHVMELAFAPAPQIAVAAVVIALAVTLGLGLAGTWRILSVKPAALLKNL